MCFPKKKNKMDEYNENKEELNDEQKEVDNNLGFILIRVLSFPLISMMNQRQPYKDNKHDDDVLN